MAEEELYDNILIAIDKCDLGFIIESSRFLIKNNKKILHPNYISLAVSLYLDNPSNDRFDIVRLLYYAGFQSDTVSYFVTKKKCDKHRERICELEFIYAIENKKCLDNVWINYKRSLYANTYKHIYDTYLYKAVVTNHKWKDVLSYTKECLNVFNVCADTYDYVDVV